MTDVSFAVMTLLMAVGGLLVALKAVPLLAGRAFIYAGALVLCARAIGIKVVALISAGAGETLSWTSFCLMAAIVLFLTARGLARTARTDKSAHQS